MLRKDRGLSVAAAEYVPALPCTILEGGALLGEVAAELIGVHAFCVDVTVYGRKCL